VRAELEVGQAVPTWYGLSHYDFATYKWLNFKLMKPPMPDWVHKYWTRKFIDEVKEDAYEDGFHDGFKSGAGFNEWQQSIKQIRKEET
jgi:hypothetical protein